MNLVHLPWLMPKDAKEAISFQKEMRKQVVLEDRFPQLLLSVGGVDVSNNLFDPTQMVFGAAVLFSYPSLEKQEIQTAKEKQEFPYIPGLLGFREAPVLIHACLQLSKLPDVLMVDGHGISHPRGLGIATHLGVLLDIPTIGVAKSILVGSPAEPLSEEVGSMTSLLWKGKEIAKMVRTKRGASPLIISAGHKITLESAVQLVLGSLRGYRLPEPTRFAHLAANECRRSFKG